MDPEESDCSWLIILVLLFVLAGGGGAAVTKAKRPPVIEDDLLARLRDGRAADPLDEYVRKSNRKR